MNWYLIHTKPRQEQCALENLQQQGFGCFLPMIRVEKLRRGKLVEIDEPLFPRYLFIQLDTGQHAQSWQPIRSTKGVSRLVSFGQEPARMSDVLVDLIRAQCGSGSVQQRHFTQGEKVLITEGPFVGLEAIYQMSDGEQRVMVLLNIMSKSVKLSLEPNEVRKVS
ncbi:MAG: transcription/translation regulatory transformer protein RfaH [Rhodoferax sp.]|nr:transcription/translation regulatory transformer protein RfaH [Rhodoferax sp.]